MPRFLLLYIALYGAYGVASPFFPAFLSARGLAPEELGLLLGAATAVRLMTSPLAGRLGDLIQRLRFVLAACALLAACAGPSLLASHVTWTLVAIALLHAGSLAPVGVLADALALGSASPPPGSTRRGFEYGRVRGAGSAAFILGTLLAGQAVGAWGLDTIVWMQATLLVVTAFAALRVAEPDHTRTPAAARSPARGVLILMRIALFRNLVLVAALILGSHAMNDAFALIRWNAAGVSPFTSSLLWSEAVAAEVLVFLLVGPALVDRLTPAGAAALAAFAAIVRWSVMAQSSDVRAIALVQPLHGITFALLHLACMRLIRACVPQGLEGTAQAIYATVGIGTATALLTLVSGAVYARLGAHGFWLMAALCALALPLTWKLR